MRFRTRRLGDIHHQSLSIEGGAYFEGRSQQTRAANGREPDELARKPMREIAHKEREAAFTAG
jgi:cytoskeletal protein CcmA (bactofilin family)